MSVCVQDMKILQGFLEQAKECHENSPRGRPKGTSEFVLLQSLQFILDMRPGIGGGRKITGSLPLLFEPGSFPVNKQYRASGAGAAPEPRSALCAC